MDANRKPLRRVVLRRSLIAGTVTASLAAPMIQATPIVAKDAGLTGSLWLASGEGEGGGEGEGEGRKIDPAVAALRDLGLAESHLRAALALSALDRDEAAAAHLGMAAAIPLPEADSAALSATVAAIRAGEGDTALTPLAGVRATGPEVTRIAALITLTRAGADLYSQAITADPADVQAYQTAWGVMQTVRAEIGTLAASTDADVAQVAERMGGYLAKANSMFGNPADMQGAATDPGVLYGAAARMELAAARLN